MLAVLTNVIIQITNIYVLFVCRLFTGVYVGLYMGIVPVYIHDLTPHRIAGFFGAFTQIQHLLGNVFSYLLGSIFYATGFQGEMMMRFQFSFTLLIVSIQLLGLMTGFVPESPNSLVGEGRAVEAREVLGLFNDREEVERILKEKAFENTETNENQRRESNITDES